MSGAQTDKERVVALDDIMREILTERYTDGVDGMVERIRYEDQYRRVVNECGRTVPQYDDPGGENE